MPPGRSPDVAPLRAARPCRPRIDGAIAEHKLPAKQYPTLEGLKTILASDPKAKGVKAEDFVDMRFIKELDDSGYIDKLYKR
jgi:hypothetical protein